MRFLLTRLASKERRRCRPIWPLWIITLTRVRRKKNIKKLNLHTPKTCSLPESRSRAFPIKNFPHIYWTGLFRNQFYQGIRTWAETTGDHSYTGPWIARKMLAREVLARLALTAGKVLARQIALTMLTEINVYPWITSFRLLLLLLFSLLLFYSSSFFLSFFSLISCFVISRLLFDLICCYCMLFNSIIRCNVGVFIY